MKKRLLFTLFILNLSVIIAQNPPTAINDTAYGMCGSEILINVLQNDYDPDGAEIEIMDVNIDGPGFHYDVQINGNTLIYNQVINVNMEMHQFEYRIREINQPDSYSNWATVTLMLEQNPDYPITVTDYQETISGLTVAIDVLENDLLNGYNPIAIPYSVSSLGSFDFDDNIFYFTPFMTANGKAKLQYRLMENDNYTAYGNIEIDIISNNSYDSLYINNINAGIHSDGYLFAKLNEIIDHEPASLNPHFEYPKGSGNHTSFCNSMWIGGIDQTESLHIAAQRYKQDGYDFQFGPISNSYDGLEFFTKWSRVWKVNRDEVNYHRSNYWKGDYEAVDVIIKWPGNGDVANGQTEQLAPFFDSNENGLYEPMDGDYPLIRGDQTVFFIYNDDRVHTETNGERMKVEIHGMAYGYDEPNDELLNNTVFVHYDIYNRSDNTYFDTYIGSWTDTDIGNAQDDYIGCNVTLGSYYGYNGNETDYYYGEHPPAQSITFLAGPFMDDDGLDNGSGGCDFSINGLNFGDGIIDNERISMSAFVYHTNNNGSQGDPRLAPEYYNYLKGIWKDDTPMIYGGTGHITSPGTVGPECNFMFPGASDPCNWGTDGVLPNDGYNQNGKYWSEETANDGSPNPPYDRRGLGVTGPFTFEPGDRQELEFAFSVGQGEDGPYSSVQQLFENLENLFELVENGEVIIPSDQLDVDENNGNKVNLKIYPNPMYDFVYVEVEGKAGETLNYLIYNSHGIVVDRGELTANVRSTIDIQRLEQGFYIIQVKYRGIAHNGRLLKL